MQSNRSRHELALREERGNLRRTLGTIQRTIQSLQHDVPFRGVGRYSVSPDYEELGNLRAMKAVNKEVEERAAFLSQFLGSPYFARMDMENVDTKDFHVMYIGQKALALDKEILVHDWRSPLGQRYYIKHELEFHHDDYSFDLLLRRALDVKEGKLVALNDEYVFGEDLFKDGVTDPFLLSVLRDKRRQYSLTNIIRTIQSKQNDIIRQPLAQSIVVQGCAGSGKTVIMLHRLSYLKFNHPNMDMRRVKIIAPHRNFNMHISALSKELELDLVLCVTMEDYYLDMLKSYDTDRWGPIETGSIVPERGLPAELISEVYSEAFVSACKEAYLGFVGSRLGSFEATDLKNKAVAQGIEWPTLSSLPDSRKIVRLRNIMTSLAGRHREAINEKARLENALRYSLANRRSGRRMRSKQRILTSKELDELREARHTEINAILDSKRMVPMPLRQRAPVMVQMAWSRVEREIWSRREERSRLTEEKNRHLTEIARLAAAGSRAMESLRSRIAESRTQLASAQAELSQLTVFSLFRRRELVAQVRRWERLLTRLEHEMAEAKAIGELSEQRLRQELAQWEDKITLQDELIIDTTDEKTLGALFNSLFVIELKASRGKSLVMNHLPPKARDKMIELRRNVVMTKLALRELEPRLLNNSELQQLEQVQNVLRDMYDNAIFNRTYGMLLGDIERANGVTESRVTRYRMMLWLHFYNQFMGPYRGQRDQMLNIDEGQELAGTEYSLLRHLHGQETVMNVYGDLNQRTSSRGVTDWNSTGIEGRAHFDLAQNYRNTNQITEHTNQQLDMSVQPIGIDGAAVSVVPMVEAIGLIAGAVANPSPERTAVIIGDSDGKLAKGFVSAGCLPHVVTDGKVALLSVEEAKGMEFERVFVLQSNMTRSEKYISYTRALKELIVVFE